MERWGKKEGDRLKFENKAPSRLRRSREEKRG